MASSSPIRGSIAPTSSAGVQFSVRDLIGFSVTCAVYFGWMRYLYRSDADPISGLAIASSVARLTYWIGICYWPMPLALMGLFPRRDPGEAAPGLSGYALWKLCAALYPVAYLASTTLVLPSDHGLWPAAIGGLGVSVLFLLSIGALMVWESGASSLPATRVEWLGLALYLYLWVALAISTTLALLG